MFNVCLIGFGNIGRRHFEALLKINFDAKIFLIDPYEHAFDNINDYNLTSSISVEFSHNYDFLPKNIDLAIIATSSDVRRKCFEQLIEKCNVKYIIFEKILFQKVEDYDYVESELNKRGIKAWVNCARREFESYQKLKKKLSESTINSINITGGNWGFGCNGIHMLDLISYLLDDQELIINKFDINNEVIESKRKGFKEFYGRFDGICLNSDTIFSICCKDSDEDLSIIIDTDSYIYIVFEKQNIILSIDKKNAININKSDYIIEFISNTTTKAVNNIYKDGLCALSGFSKSKELHLKFIKPVLEFLNEVLGETNICPIT